ncbi:MAG: transposase [Geminicoccaceae bacterium]|nr:transposase [Geminicoccaceae bacterium]
MSRRRRPAATGSPAGAPTGEPPGTEAPPPEPPPIEPPEPSCPSLSICPVCGCRGRLVWIHGEGRCPACGTVLDFCCAGAPLDGGEG